MTAKKLTIGLFAHREPSFVKKQMAELAGISRSLLSQIHISILATGLGRNLRSLRRLPNVGSFWSIGSALRAEGISCSVKTFADYWSKSVFLSQTDTPLILKLDEDVFLTSQAWEAFLEVAMSEGQSSRGVMSAALSTGIGSETQRPFACVIVGGIISATAAMLVLLPLGMRRVMSRQEPASGVVME